MRFEVGKHYEHITGKKMQADTQRNILHLTETMDTRTSKQ